MTPTERCAVFRFTPPTGKKMLVWINAHTEAHYDSYHAYFAGRSNANNGGVEGDFGCRFVAYLSDENGEPLNTPQLPAVPSTPGIAAVEVTPGMNCVTPGVTLVVGTSFMNEEQARANVGRECGNSRGLDDFKAICRQSAQVWEKALGVVRVEGGSDAQRRTFYTCLYRTQLFPRELHEFDASGANRFTTALRRQDTSRRSVRATAASGTRTERSSRFSR